MSLFFKYLCVYKTRKIYQLNNYLFKQKSTRVYVPNNYVLPTTKKTIIKFIYFFFTETCKSICTKQLRSTNN